MSEMSRSLEGKKESAKEKELKERIGAYQMKTDAILDDLSALIADENLPPPNPLEPIEVTRKKAIALVRNQFTSINERFEKAGRTLVSELEKLNQLEGTDVQEDLDLLIPALESSSFADLEKIDKQIKGGVVLQKTLGLPDAALEKYYRAGLVCFEEQRFEDSGDIFLILSFLNPADHSSCLAWGISAQNCGYWDEAIGAYETALLSDPQDPEPYSLIAECYVEIREVEKALDALDQGINLAENNSEFADMEKSMVAFRNGLKNKTK